MLLHNPAKLPPIDRFEKLPKNAIYAAHARPLSESRQPESIQFVLDLPGMRCGIVNHSPDSPALAGEGWGGGAVASRWVERAPTRRLRADLPRNRDRSTYPPRPPPSPT